jgi:hypothetical protein
MDDPRELKELVWQVALPIADAGYELSRISDEFKVYLARPIVERGEKTLPRFLIAVRTKTKASFRHITQEYEFGIDAPDMGYYATMTDAFPEAPFYIVFPVVEAKKIWFGDLTEIHKKSRYWRDRIKFPNGIFFIETKNLKEWNRSEVLEMLNKLNYGDEITNGC